MSGATSVLQGVIFFGLAGGAFMGLAAALPRGKRVTETRRGPRDNFRLQRRMYGGLAALLLTAGVGAAIALGVLALL